MKKVSLYISYSSRRGYFIAKIQIDNKSFSMDTNNTMLIDKLVDDDQETVNKARKEIAQNVADCFELGQIIEDGFNNEGRPNLFLQPNELKLNNTSSIKTV